MIKLLLPPFIPAPFWSESATQVTSVITNMSLQPVVGVSSLPIDVPPSLDPLSYVCGLWLLGTVICILIPLISTVILKNKLKHAESLPMDNERTIQVRKSDQISMPLTIGLNPKEIFVPSLWEQWSEECRVMILRHELAHIERRDGLVQLLQSLVRAVYFFHPLVWLLSKKMNEYREMACDDTTVGKDRQTSVEYSRYLVEIAEEITQNQLGCSSASALIRQKNQLLNRVKYQMEDAMINLTKRKAGIVFIGLILLTMGLSWTRGNPRENPLDETNLSPTNLPVNPISQDIGKIWGTVTDMKSGEPLPGANIVVKGTRFGAASDVNGEFFIVKIPPGKYILEATMIGFENKIIADVLVKIKDSSRIDFKLDRAVVYMATAKVKKGVPLTPPQTGQEDVPVFIPFDEPPEPIGGYMAIQNNLKYPEIARLAGVEGRVMIWAKIGTESNVLKTMVMRSLGPNGCDEAAMAAIRAVKWKPAKQRDKQPIAVWIAVPVDFRLDEETRIISIFIEGKDKILIGRKEPYTFDNMEEAFAEVENMSKMVISITPNGNVTVGLVSDVQKKLRELGATKISFHIK